MGLAPGSQVVATTTINKRTAPGLLSAVIGSYAPTDAPVTIAHSMAVDDIEWYQTRSGFWLAGGYGGDTYLLDASDLFLRSVAFVLSEEGGMSRDPNDNGNWTGGKIGVGELRGTKYGISAASHPEVDIANLTTQGAIEVYRYQYWELSKANQQPWPLCVAVLDTAVLHGVGQARQWLTAARGELLPFVSLRLSSYTALSTWMYHGAGWINRMARLMKVCAN